MGGGGVVTQIRMVILTSNTSNFSSAEKNLTTESTSLHVIFYFDLILFSSCCHASDHNNKVLKNSHFHRKHTWKVSSNTPSS